MALVHFGGGLLCGRAATFPQGTISDAFIVHTTMYIINIMHLNL
jgi:hypothetical protein